MPMGLASDNQIVNEINKIMIFMGQDKILPKIQKYMSMFEDIQQAQSETKQSVFELKAIHMSIYMYMETIFFFSISIQQVLGSESTVHHSVVCAYHSRR